MSEKSFEEKVKGEVINCLNQELDDLRLREASIKKRIDDVKAKGVDIDANTYMSMLKYADNDDLLVKGYAKLILDGVLFLDYFEPHDFRANEFGWCNPKESD